MPEEKKKTSAKKAAYDIEYKKKNLKRVPLDLQLSDYDRMKETAGAMGMTVNGFIKQAIKEKMERDSADK